MIRLVSSDGFDLVTWFFLEGLKPLGLGENIVGVSKMTLCDLCRMISDLVLALLKVSSDWS